MNLLTETKEKLHDFKKSTTDVLWVGSTDYGWFSWKAFAKLADKHYDSGFGGQEVATDLVIVGVNWWMERHEYDGSEWWEFKTMPKMPTDNRVPESLFAETGWETLDEINGEE